MTKFAADVPRRHHLDRRAASLVNIGAEDAADDDLLSTREVAIWLGVSDQWLEIGRSKGWGPPFVRLSPRRIRYSRGDVAKWLRDRTHARTADYANAPGAA